MREKGACCRLQGRRTELFELMQSVMMMKCKFAGIASPFFEGFFFKVRNCCEHMNFFIQIEEDEALG